MVDVVAFGLGPIGQRIASRLQSRTGVRLVGATDLNPDLVGADLGELLDAGPSGVEVTEAFDVVAPDGGVVVHATGSRLGTAADDLIMLLQAGWNVVSTCEELVCPAIADPEIVAALDAAARSHRVSILGSGINPGFVMDTLVIVLTSACTHVDAVEVVRRVDTNSRRIPLQKKSGVGMFPDEFRELASRGEIGHVGLRQSAHLVMTRLGWELISYDDSLEPIIAAETTSTPLGQIPEGRVVGQRQLGVGRASGGRKLSYTLEMAAGLSSTDEIHLQGEPSVRLRIDGGINGDIGTEAVIANLVPIVSHARVGLLTMADLVPIGCQP